MAAENGEFLAKLLATFRIEADEHLEAMSSSLVELEKMPHGARRSDLIETIFREAHSLKGAARAVNHANIESLCQSLESLFFAMKGGAEPPGATFDLLYQSIDALGELLSGASAQVRGPAIAQLIRRLDDASAESPAAGDAPATPPAPLAAASPAAAVMAPEVAEAADPQPMARSAAPDTVRISSDRLDATMRQAEELLAARLAAGERVRELREALATLVARKKERDEAWSSLRTLERSLQRSGNDDDRRVLARLIELTGGGDVFAKGLADRLSALATSAAADHRALTVMVDTLLHNVKEMQLLPLASLLQTLPRMVRELARDRGKQASLAVRGGDIDVDRRLLDELKDPLIHLLRNCVDHGIETPAVRTRSGKPAQGAITIAVAHKDSGKIEITIADDGAGIDARQVVAAAARLEESQSEGAPPHQEHEALSLVFRSGVSTSPIITDLSGRGLGLAIVREKIERLGGAISLESRSGAGTTFRIELPLTLATLRGVLVRAGERPFVVPASSVDRVVRVAARDIETIRNRDTITLEGHTVSLARLVDVLELPRADRARDPVHAVVIDTGSTRTAFEVDEVIGEQEVLVKALGPQLARVRNVSGASVLGTGEVVPVLNVPDLMQSAASLTPPARASAVEKPAEERPREVLVVEDSVTSRSLLKNILESAGYSVRTAVDGLDGYTALKTANFDLVVSDVEMPRMDGFELTARIRADDKLSELPVVLVTALDQREHRERGVEAGANAYIVKSSFDQSNLLEVVRRLIP